MKRVSLIFVLLALLMLTGCDEIKDNTIGKIDELSKRAGDLILTSDARLVGKRTYGKDHYTGSYQAYYDVFTGEETLFGGTTLNRAEGDNISLRVSVERVSGQISIIANLKEQEKVLVSDAGTYEFNLNVKDGSNYVLVKASDFTGKLQIEAK